MKTIGRVLLVVVGLVFSLPPLYAHTTSVPYTLRLSSAEYDNLLATLAQTTPTSPEAIPRDATLFSAANPLWPPFPGNVNNLSAWSLGSNIWLLSDLDFSYDVTPSPAMASPMGRFGPMGGSGGDPLDQFSTNDLWLELLDGSVTNDSASFVVHTPQPGVFDLFFTTNFEPATWFWIARGLPGQTNFTELGFLPPDTGFFIAGTTNGLDQYSLTTAYYDLVGDTNTLSNDLNNNGIPDYWEIEFFGDLSQSASSHYGGTRISILDAWLDGADPNQITFSFWFPQPRVNVNSATGSVAVLNGVPSYMAVLVNNTNFAAAVWQPYSSNFVATLGTNDGAYDVWLGLRGRAPISQATWMDATVTRDTVPPVLVITNPAPGSTNPRLIVQLQGCADKPLQNLCFDLTNAAGSIFDQPGFIVHQQVDTNAIQLSTNWFQCYDVALTNGPNAITLRATDLAGNTATTNFVITFDPTTDTNPPAITIVWPPDQSSIAGTNFSLRGILDDDTATISVSGLGTNAIAGTVERGGTFRVANLPLIGPTNVLTLTASNTAGFASTLELTVYQSSVTVTVDPINPASLSQSYITVTGEISDTNEVLSVNGVPAVITGGTWEADYVPVMDHNATADFDIDVSAPTNQPPAPDPIETVAVTLPSVVRPSAYTEVYNFQFNLTSAVYAGGSDTWTRTRTWEEGVGGSSRQYYLEYQGSECDSELVWPAFWPDGQGLPGQDCNGSFAIGSGVPWMNYALQASAMSSIDGRPGLVNTVSSSSRRMQTTLELATAGPAQPGVQRLTLLTISAAGYSQPLPLGATLGSPRQNEYDYDNPGDTPVAATSILVNGLPVTPSDTNSTVAKMLVSQPAGSVQRLQITTTDTNSQAYSVTAQPEDVMLQSLTVVSNTAAQVDATDWAVVKSTSTNDYVIVQATLSLSATNAALLAQVGAAIQWTGGQPVPGNPFQRQISKTNSVETTVTATLGSTNLSLNVWVVWANLTIKVTGTLDPDDQAEVLVNSNWPTPAAFNVQLLTGNGLGGGNSLGSIDCLSDTNLNYGYTIGKMEAKAVLQPTGVGNILAGAFYMNRIATAIGWINGGSPVVSYQPPGVVDDSAAWFQFVSATNGEIFDLDGPGCPITGGTNINHTAEVYDNYYEFVTVYLAGYQACSDVGNFSYTAQVDVDATNKVQLNILSPLLIALPTTPHYTQR